MTEGKPLNQSSRHTWLYTITLITVLMVGAYLRLVGLDWDQDQHLHPDERFLTMVEGGIAPVNGWGEYFNTPSSSLNPHNRGYGFFVYGTLPIFIVRYVAEWLNQTGYGEVYIIGRALSALVDLFTVFLVYLVGKRLYDRRVGLLAAAFSASSVLPIQQSHFFTVDTFINFFTFLAILFAVKVATTRYPQVGDTGYEGMEEGGDSSDDQEVSFWQHPLFLPSLLFGLALGMAVASKINAAPVAITLPAAAGLYWYSLSPDRQKREGLRILAYLVMAAVVSLLAFRVFQPYAFTGPGFFGVKPNPDWLSNLRDLRAQTTGDVDFPPALQWARRPVWFSLKNMVLWGLGAPLGLLAWGGFLWMGWRMLKGKWRRHALLWGWTGIYFVWQSLVWNSTMRYQLPVYPALAIFAAWAVLRLYDREVEAITSRDRSSFSAYPFKVAAVVIGAGVLLATLAWAFAFTRIYTRPHTRVQASRWLFQNAPGPINLNIQTGEGVYHQPLVFPSGVDIRVNQPFQTSFVAQAGGELTEVYLAHVADLRATSVGGGLQISLSAPTQNEGLLGVTAIPAEEIPVSSTEGAQRIIRFDQPIVLIQDQSYLLTMEAMDGLEEVEVCGPLKLHIQTSSETVDQSLPAPQDCLVDVDSPITTTFIPKTDGVLEEISLGGVSQKQTFSSGSQILSMELSTQPEGEPLVSAWLEADFSTTDEIRGEGYAFELDQPVRITEGETYYLRFELEAGQGAIIFEGARLANESTWDDGLPLRMDGYDPYGGIYPGGLNFEMYWDDNPEKLERFVTTLDQADYVLISSSRQWGSTTRVPERYPLNSEYYRRLLGCPGDQTIEWCYNVAQTGTFQGDLGFDLVKVFQSNPKLGPWEINDQFAEEAFTVYDHPKVMIFRKSPDYDGEQVREILGAVDLSRVIRVTPRQADSYPGDLMLPSERLVEQRQGGTWSELFDRSAPQNRFHIVGIAVWYLSVSLVGWMVYPLVRIAFPSLKDRGYPLIRTAGLLLLSYLVWMAGSFRIPFSRLTIGLVLALMAALGGYLTFRQRDGLRREWRRRRYYYLLVEALFLTFFIVGLLIRLGNPDLWHPWKGGEKPMDFSYFNAVLKSTSFPPYDPWYAGGYINYYYFGFVFVGVLVKFLGIVPAIAYNLILPTLFAMIALGAFSIGWNLSNHRGGEEEDTQVSSQTGSFPSLRMGTSFLPALGAALGMSLLGNLGTLRMILRGYQNIAATVEDIDTAGILSRILWTFQGFVKALTGTSLSIRLDEWYWNPSRVIAAEHGGPITEFPFFTYLYADLHAHLIALPITLLALAWVLSFVLDRGRKRSGYRSLQHMGLGLFFGALIIGALFPTNTWDYYPYLGLGVIGVGYALKRIAARKSGPGISNLKGWGGSAMRWLVPLGGILLLIGLSVVLYQPYRDWYGQGYSQVELWSGSRTPTSDYLTHWGLFLFVIVSWMFSESVDWMAKTPVSALRKLEPYREWIIIALAALVILMIVLGVKVNWEDMGEDPMPLGLGVHIAWWVLPLGVWAVILLLRPGQSEAKRVVLFLVGTALALTLMVEIIVLRGDVGRMNTVFKFYLQSWTLFAISAAAALGWLWARLTSWDVRWRTGWQLVMIFLVASAGLYPLLASVAKIEDRMEESAPHTLNGMAFMKYATYHDLDTAMDLSQDYDAIRWMQEDVEGSPVIVEGNMVEYHWGTRYTIYTGLPGVVGWNWHQRQQRALVPDTWIFDRVEAVHEFYRTTDLDWARDFLKTYQVSYIVVGQLERAKYPGPGLEKFSEQDGALWHQVYHDQDTTVYQVRGN